MCRWRSRRKSGRRAGPLAAPAEHRSGARGRRAAKDPSGLGFSDLNEALGYATEGGYRRYEADVRVALAWAHLAAGEPVRARQETERARRMSEGMGYHWGQVDAAEVLAALDGVSSSNSRKN